MLNKQKRGQVTIFIIVGFILLTAVALVFYLSSVGDKTTIDEQISQEKKLPGELDSVRVSIKKCLKDTSLEGLKLAGMQGGWISTKSDFVVSKEFNFNPDPTLADGIKENSMGVPYWYMMESSNSCSGDCNFESLKPSLKSDEISGEDRSGDDYSIEAQMDRYIKREMPKCLENVYEEYEGRFDIKEKTSLNPTTTITPKEVLVVLDYEVEVSDQQTESTVEGSYVRLQFPFADIYDLAEEIRSAERQYNFIERGVMNMISVYGGVDSDKLPPIAATTTEMGKMVVWSETAVKNKLKNEVLVPGVQSLKLPGTENYRATQQAPEGVFERMAYGMVSSFSTPILNETHPEYSVNFVYLDWPLYLDITPSNGDLLEPQKTSADFSGLAEMFIQNYEFRYDMTFPVMVMIETEEAHEFEKGKYLFQYAVEPNIRNNRPFTSQDSIPGVSSEQESLWGDHSQRLSGNITIISRDKKTQEALPGVKVKYICGEESTTIGSTKLNESGVAVLKEKFPICIGGLVQFDKQGYQKYTVRFDTQIGEEEVLIADAPTAPENVEQD